MASKYDKLLGALREDDADGAGATELSGLSDVGVTTPTNRNVLVADGDSWESRALVEADISDLQSYLTSVNIADINATGTPDGTTVLFGDGTWAAPAGGGTIGGSTGATDNAILRADGVGGATLQNTGVIIDDSDNLNVPTGSQYLYDNKNMFSITSAGTFYGDNLRNIGLSAAGTVSDNFIIGDGNAGQEIGSDASGSVQRNLVIGAASTMYRMGRYNANVTDNVGIGTLAGYQAALGAPGNARNVRFNIFMGYASGSNFALASTAGTVEKNIFIGASAGQDANNNATSGGSDRNLFFGSSAGYQAKDGSTTGAMADNVFIGNAAGLQMGFGTGATAVINNTLIGSYAGYQWGLNTSGAHSGNVLIGQRAGFQNTTGGSNKLYIENSNSSTPLVYGEFDNDFVNINGDFGVGIGNTAPSAKAHIDQNSTTGAMPVITLDQADVSEEFIRLIGESTTDATQSLVDAADLTTPGTIQGWFKIYVEDVQGTGPITDGVYYVPFYSAPTA